MLTSSLFATPVTCATAQGKIDLTTAGGTTPIQYLWSNGSTTEDLVGLTSGSYSVSVTDARSCITTDSIVVIDDPMVIDAFAPIYYEDYNLTAYQSNDGEIDLTVTGDASPFTYSWSNGETTC